MRCLILLLVLGLAACAGPEGSRATPAVEVGQTALPATPTPDTAPYPDTAEGVVEAMLAALVAEPALARRYLAPDLQARVDAGTPVAEVLEIEPGYDSFEVVPGQSQAEGAVFVQVSLSYAAPRQYLVALVRQAERWQIIAVSAL